MAGTTGRPKPRPTGDGWAALSIAYVLVVGVLLPLGLSPSMQLDDLAGDVATDRAEAATREAQARRADPPNAAPTVASVSCVASRDVATRCSMTASDDSGRVRFTVAWDDGVVDETRAVAPSETVTAIHRFREGGPHFADIVATDDGSPALSSSPLRARFDVPCTEETPCSCVDPRAECDADPDATDDDCSDERASGRSTQSAEACDSPSEDESCDDDDAQGGERDAAREDDEDDDENDCLTRDRENDDENDDEEDDEKDDEEDEDERDCAASARRSCGEDDGEDDVCDGATSARGCGNRGTVKVHDTSEARPAERNEPHVDCDFWVEGFGLDDARGAMVFFSWPPTGDRSVVTPSGASLDWVDDGVSDDPHFLSGPFSLPTGHYRLEVFTLDRHAGHEHFAKAKTFWTECDPEDPGPPPQTWYPGAVGTGANETVPDPAPTLVFADGALVAWNVSSPAAATTDFRDGLWTYTVTLEEPTATPFRVRVGYWDDLNQTYVWEGATTVTPRAGATVYSGAVAIADSSFVIPEGSTLAFAIEEVPDGAGSLSVVLGSEGTRFTAPTGSPQYPTPELSTLALALAGLVFLGFAVRRASR